MQGKYHINPDILKGFEHLDKVQDFRYTDDLDKNIIWGDIMVIVPEHQGKGIGREVLKFLYNGGYWFRFRCKPLENAMPFWRKMYAEGLIDTNPDGAGLINGREIE